MKSDYDKAARLQGDTQYDKARDAMLEVVLDEVIRVANYPGLRELLYDHIRRCGGLEEFYRRAGLDHVTGSTQFVERLANVLDRLMRPQDAA